MSTATQSTSKPTVTLSTRKNSILSTGTSTSTPNTVSLSPRKIQAMGNVIINLLQDIHNAPKQMSTKKKKINVPAGRSVSIDDIGEDITINPTCNVNEKAQSKKLLKKPKECKKSLFADESTTEEEYEDIIM